MSLATEYARPHPTFEGGRAIAPRTFAMKSEFRRCAIYALAAMLLIPLVGWWRRTLRPDDNSGAPWAPLVICSVMALGPIGILRWRLRVDESGISRRRLIGWDLWPWQTFALGRVLDAENSSGSFILPEKRLWNRKLSIALIDDDDCLRVQAMIDQVRVRSEPTLPGELRLRSGFRQQFVIDPGCLVVRDRKEECRYGWNEVELLRIRRRTRTRRDFSSLELVLPGRVVQFSVRHHQGQMIRSWSGLDGSPTPSAEVLSGVLERCVSPDRVQVTALDESPRTITEWEDQRSILVRRGQELKLLNRMIVGCGAVLLGLIAFELYRDRSSAIGLLIMSPMLVLIWAVVRMLDRERKSAESALESQIPEH
jgi:hypothetical protein